MHFINILSLAFWLMITGLLAQNEDQSFRLLGEEDGLPIVQATFVYGNQKGVSDEAGRILFRYTAGEAMVISHLTYGSWSLNDADIQQALQTGQYVRKTSIWSLHPATVIGVRYRGQQPQDEIGIAYQDRMEHDAADILNQVPAFNSIRKGGNYGFDPVFRGFKNDQLNVVFNGAQSATAACPNRMDPPTSQMAPNMMDRIEILKGPHALRFGAGLGATINFIPAQLRFSSQPAVYGRLSSAYESNGEVVRGEGQLGFSGQKYDISLFAAWSEGNDYQAGNGEEVQADFSRGSYGVNAGFKLAPKQEIRLSALYNRARDADFPALPMDLRLDDTWLFSARHDILVGGEQLQSWNTTLFGSFVDHLMNNGLKPLNPRMLNAETAATTYNYGGRTEGNWLLKKAKLYAGADLRVEGAAGTRVREFLLGPMAGRVFEDNAWQEGQINKIGLFAEYQIQGGAWDYVVSARLEANQADINDPTSEFTQVNAQTNINQFNPSFSLGAQKRLGAKTTLGLWLARAQRSGNLTERFINYFPVGQDPFEMLGNPQLDPEVNNQLDLTLEWNIREGSAIALDVYAAYLQDYISSVIDTSLTPRLPASPGVRQFVNISEVFKTGFELSWTQNLIAGLGHRLSLAYTYAQDLERDEPLPEIAPLDFRYTLHGSYLNKRLRPELLFRYVAEQSRVSREFGETPTPSFALLDVKVGYQISEAFSLSVGVNNLLDENYYEHLNRSVRGTSNPIFTPGRNVFARANFTF